MEQFKLKLVSSAEKVLASAEPSGAGMNETLSVLKNDTVSFQLAYYWNGPWRQMAKLRIQAPEFLNVRTRMVKLTPCAYPCHAEPERDSDYLTTEPSMIPDILSEIPPVGFPLTGGQWRSLWIDVEPGEDALPGEYTVELLIDREDGTDTASVTVEVIDAVLPKHPLRHTEWFHCDGIAQYYGIEVFSETFWQYVENFAATAARRGCNMILTPVFTPPLDTAVGGERLTVQLVDVYEKDGGYVFGYNHFERWVEMCDRVGMKYFEISHLFSQWGAKAAPKIMGTTENGEYKRLFGWETESSGPEYTAFLHAFLHSFTQELTKLGLEKRCYFHISDEPPMDSIEYYSAARKIVDEELADYPIIDALSDYDFYQKGLVKEPICATNHIEPFLADRPEKLWAYYCTGQGVKVSNRFIAMQGSRARILALQLYKYEIAGFLHWGYNFYNSQLSLYPIDPYHCTDCDGAFQSGDPFLVYPGKNGVPEESIRLMLMDAVMKDVAAMYYLESLTDRETVLKCFDEEHAGEITFSEYPKDVDYTLKVREKINQEIKKALK